MSEDRRAPAILNVRLESPVSDYGHCPGNRNGVPINHVSADDSAPDVNTDIEPHIATQAAMP